MILPEISSSMESFPEIRDSLSKSPEGGAAITLAALMALGKDRARGLQMLTIALDRDNLTNGNVYKGYAPDRGIMYHIDRLNSPK